MTRDSISKKDAGRTPTRGTAVDVTEHRVDLDDNAVFPGLPPALTSVMSRLFNAGFSLISLGGYDGKKSTLKFAKSGRMPLSVVINRMSGGGSQTYGIRTSGLLVVDVDIDTPEARQYVEARFGCSSARTRTPRGMHYYFRHIGKKPADVSFPNIRIEFKSGENEYVVGPGSQRPDGGTYIADAPLTSHKDLPWFLDRQATTNRQKSRSAGPGRQPLSQAASSIGRGFRHTALKNRARELTLVAESLDEVIGDLIAFRDWEIEQADEFPDAMVEKMASWFWDKREAGALWGGKNSGVFIHRDPINELARRGEALALLLYNVVVSSHGHMSDREFSLSPDGLRKSGRIKAGREQLYDAIHLLVELDLLVRRTITRGKRLFYRYQIGAPWLHKKEGGGSFLTLVPESSTSLTLVPESSTSLTLVPESSTSPASVSSKRRVA